MQSLQTLESCTTSCKEGMLPRAPYTLQPTCNLSRNAIATQVAKKIAACNTSCKAWFYFLQGIYGIVGTTTAGDCNVFFENIACCSPRFATCNMSVATCNGFLFPTLRDILQRELHRATLALGSIA